MNVTIMTGKLTRDPKLVPTKGGKACVLRLVETYTPAKKPLFITVFAIDREAEVCAKYLSKGRHVLVSGHLQFRESEPGENGKPSEHSIAASRVVFLGDSHKQRGAGGQVVSTSR